MEGRRQMHLQMILCAKCGSKVLVYPLTPLAREEAGSVPRRGLWGRGSVGVAVVLLGLVGVLVGGVIYVMWPAGVTVDEREAFQTQLDEALGHRQRGRFHRAAAMLDRLQKQPAAGEREAELRQMHRQVALAADLSLLSIEELVRLVQFQPDAEEWEAIWRGHRGKGIVLDSYVRHDMQGRPFLAEQRFYVEEKPVRLVLEELTLLEQLPRHVTQRVIFGFRLGRIEKTAEGWCLYPQPQSGVFFTDRATLEALSPVELDADLADVLERQSRWVAESGR
jgi:hypothetical protein